MKAYVDAETVYDHEDVPEYEFEKYQRGFLGILNNAYNQSCNAGSAKLGTMSDIENSFVDENPNGSWADFVRHYMREHSGADRIERAIEAMADNVQDRVQSVGGTVPRDQARFWSRKYIWSMLFNTYKGFCTEEAAIQALADELGVPCRTNTTSIEETAGIDGYIGGSSVQVKPVSFLGNLDHSGYDSDYVIRYMYEDGEFVFQFPSGIIPEQSSSSAQYRTI